MRARACFSSWALTGALLLVPALARAEDVVKPYPACDKTPTDDEVKAAKGAFDAGDVSFKEADYDRAITYWEDAYRRDCTAHRLLLNLAAAYEHNDQKRHAVNALETFLARSPGSSEENQLKRRIDKLDEQIRSETPASGPPVAATSPPPAVDTTQAPPPPPPSAPESSEGKRSIVPLIVASAGGAIMIVSGLVWVSAQSDISNFEKQCPSHVCPPDKPGLLSDANSARTRSDVSGGVALAGLGIGVGGLIWYFVEKPEPAESPKVGFKARVTPELGYGYGGVQLTGAF